MKKRKEDEDDGERKAKANKYVCVCVCVCFLPFLTLFPLLKAAIPAKSTPAVAKAPKMTTGFRFFP